MSKQILRIEALHKVQEFITKMKHNYRLIDVKNADPERDCLNRSLIDLPEGEDYLTFFWHKVQELPYYDNHNLRKNGVIGLEVLLSFGLSGLPEDFSLNDWVEASVAWLISEYGRENIASAVLHMDEGVPHIHCVAIPVKDGKIKSLYPTRQSLRDLHKRYYQYVKDFGLEPENRYMSIEHEKVGKFYGAIDESMKKTLPPPEQDEVIDDYLERLNQFYQEEILKEQAKEHQVRQLKKEKKALEKANHTLSKKLDERDEELEERFGSRAHIEKAVNFYDGVGSAIYNASQSENDADRRFAQQVEGDLHILHDNFYKKEELEYEQY